MMLITMATHQVNAHWDRTLALKSDVVDPKTEVRSLEHLTQYVSHITNLKRYYSLCLGSDDHQVTYKAVQKMEIPANTV